MRAPGVALIPTPPELGGVGANFDRNISDAETQGVGDLTGPKTKVTTFRVTVHYEKYLG